MNDLAVKLLLGFPVALLLYYVWREERQERKDQIVYMRQQDERMREMMRAQMTLAEQVRDELQALRSALDKWLANIIEGP